MGLFRRRRPLHEQLAEEADLDIGQEPPEPRAFSGFLHNEGLFDAAGIHRDPPSAGVGRCRDGRGRAPRRPRHFAALADGTLIVDEEVPDDALVPVAEAIEGSLAAPYRAVAVRQDDRIWAVGAKRIDVRAFPGRDGDELELVEDDHVILGRRLDGDLFEIEVTPL